eukprot:1459635-Rhodomonas_salina.2
MLSGSTATTTLESVARQTEHRLSGSQRRGTQAAAKKPGETGWVARRGGDEPWPERRPVSGHASARQRSGWLTVVTVEVMTCT